VTYIFAMDADDLRIDFEQSKIHWMNFVGKPLASKETFGKANEFGAEVSLPMSSNLSASCNIYYTGKTAKASDSSIVELSPGIYDSAATSIKNEYYVVGLLGGVNLYSRSEQAPGLAYYLHTAVGLATLHMKNQENFTLDDSPSDEFINWGGTYNDVTYAAEMTGGMEYQMHKRAFAFFELGYVMLKFGKIKGDEKWTGADTDPLTDPGYAHTPPYSTTFTAPYDGTLEVNDTQALKPDGTALDVDLSGYVMRIGMGLYIF